MLLPMKSNKACDSHMNENCLHCDVRDQSLLCSHPTAINEIEKARASCSFQAGQTIFYAGNEPLGIYTIQKGVVKLEVTSTGGNAHTLRFLGPGGTLGYRSLFSGENYHATAIAVEDCKLCFIPKNTLFLLVKSHPEMAMQLLSHISRDLRAAEKKWMDQMDKGAAERIAEALLFLQEHFTSQNWTRREIAEWAGTTPETVIRTLSHFEKEGLIDQTDGRNIRLLHREKLREFADLHTFKKPMTK